MIDGATIKPLIGEDGRAPEPPDPAYQQILKGIPAADFSAEELLYPPRNPRAHRLYGMSPVEQIANTQAPWWTRGWKDATNGTLSRPHRN